MTPRQTASTPPTDAQWNEQVCARLMACIPDLVPGSPAVLSINRWVEDVWLVELAEGGRIIAKQQFYGLLTRDEPHDLLQVEFDALRYLRRCGAAVPMPFGIDPEAQIILLEYAGRETVADVLVTPLEASTRRQLAAQILRQLTRIETHLQEAQIDWSSRVIPGASAKELTTDWADVPRLATKALLGLWRRSCGSEPAEALVAQVLLLCERLGRRTPKLGISDYQPANIVVDEQRRRVTFLELSKLGWDWTERRAVQYTTSVGGSGISLLDADVVAQSPLDGDALDGHHILFLLLLAGRMLATDKGDITGLARALGTPLSRDPITTELRRGLQRLTLAE